MGTKNKEPSSGLFSLRLSPYVRQTPESVWANITVEIGGDSDFPCQLNYQSSATMNREGFQEIESFVNGSDPLDPRKWVAVMEAMAVAFPPGSCGAVWSDNFHMTFTSPAAPKRHRR